MKTKHKNYETPRVEVLKLELEDVIAASPFGGGAPPHPFTMTNESDGFNPPIHLG